MPRDAYGVTTSEWEIILAAAEELREKLPDLTREVTSLKVLLGTVQNLKAQQESLTARRQATTQELHAKITEGKRIVEAIRHAAKWTIGRRSERMVHFGVAPLRKPGPRKAKPKAPEGAPES